MHHLQVREVNSVLPADPEASSHAKTQPTTGYSRADKPKASPKCDCASDRLLTCIDTVRYIHICRYEELVTSEAVPKR
jgi:hypothetical protein